MSRKQFKREKNLLDFICVTPNGGMEKDHYADGTNNRGRSSCK